MTSRYPLDLQDTQHLRELIPIVSVLGEARHATESTDCNSLVVVVGFINSVR